jgi:hypothetical protein
VDNIGILSDDVPLVERDISGAATHFNALGLSIHEMEVSDVLGVALGIAIHVSRYETSTESKRWWTLRLALRSVLKRPKIAGWELELLLGHMTFCGLMSREVLSCFHVVYRFIQNSYWTRDTLWQTAREEINAFFGLMIFLRSSWTRRWLPVVYQTDASPSGFGVATAIWTADQVAEVGRVLERRRFKLGAGQARAHAAASAGFTIDDVTGLIVADPDAEPVHRWEVDPQVSRGSLGEAQCRALVPCAGRPLDVS